MGKKIAVTAALGGQGCTVSAACLGQAAAKWDKPTVMLDLCGFGGTLSSVLCAAEEASMNVADVVRGDCTAEEALLHCGERLRLLPAAAFSGEPFLPYCVESRRLAESLAREGEVIADLPAGAVPDGGAVQCFDVFVICACPDQLSLRFAAALRALIAEAAAQSSARCDIRLLLTRFSPEHMRSGGVESIDECIDTVGAKLLGVLPYDAALARAVRQGQPIDAGSEPSLYAEDALRRLYGERIALDSKHTGAGKRFFRSF